MHELREPCYGPFVHRGHRHNLLGKDIERIARYPGRLDLAAQHPVDHDRGLQQVAAVLGEDRALRRFADGMAGAPDPLNSARHTGR